MKIEKLNHKGEFIEVDRSIDSEKEKYYRQWEVEYNKKINERKKLEEGWR